MKWYSRSVSLGGVGDDRYALMECQTSELCIHEYSCNYMLCYCKIGLIEKVSIWRTEGPKSPIEQGPGWWWAACQLSHRHTPLAAHQRAFIWVNTSDLMHPGAPLRPGGGQAAQMRRCCMTCKTCKSACRPPCGHDLVSGGFETGRTTTKVPRWSIVFSEAGGETHGGQAGTPAHWLKAFQLRKRLHDSV